MLGDNLHEPILELMRSNPKQPVTKSHLARHLKIPVERRSELRKTIDAMIQEGTIHEGKKATYLLRTNQPNVLSGTLKFHPKGHAFFYPELTNEQNLATGIDLDTNGHIVQRLGVHDRDGNGAGDRGSPSNDNPGSDHACGHTSEEPRQEGVLQELEMQDGFEEKHHRRRSW